MIPRHARAILVVRLSARGDVAFASPLAAALRRSFPDARLSWVVEERAADVIRHNPHLDRVIVWERQRWKRLLSRGRLWALGREVRAFSRELRQGRFDAVIDAQGLLRSGAVAFATRAPVRIGLGSREGSRRLMTALVERGGDARRVSSEYRHLAARLGLEVGSFAMETPRSATELEGARRLLGPSVLEAGFVAVCPFTTRFHKHWPVERWPLLIERTIERTGLGVALLGGPGDRAAADRIVDRAGVGVTDLVGKTTLGEAAAVVSLCRALVGVDTGLSHMAQAFQRPSVLLFGSNTPYLDPPGPDATILHSGRPCSPCRGKLSCDGRIDCMTDLTVQQVFASLERHLTTRRLPAVPGTG